MEKTNFANTEEKQSKLLGLSRALKNGKLTIEEFSNKFDEICNQTTAIKV